MEDNSNEIQETAFNMAYNVNTLATTGAPQSVSDSVQSDIDRGYTIVQNNRGEHFFTSRNLSYNNLNRISRTGSRLQVLESETESIKSIEQSSKVRSRAVLLPVLLIVALVGLLLASIGIALFATIKLLQTELLNTNRRIEIMSIFLTQEWKQIEGTQLNPASSCSNIPLYRPSGDYWILTNSANAPFKAYCNMNKTSCSCNTTEEGWTRVANDTNPTCPDGLKLVLKPSHTCGRSNTSTACASTVFSTHGIEYSKIYGRFRSHLHDSLDAFFSNDNNTYVDTGYIVGVSLMQEQPPQDILTFCEQLPQPTSGDIKLKLCLRDNMSNEDLSIEIIEIFIH